MTKKIADINYQDNLSLAIKLMRQRKVGSLLVKDGEKVRGIFTERDLLDKININNPNLDKFKVKDLMSSNIKTVNYKDSYVKVIGLMQRYNIRHMPVVKKNKIIGIVSLRDLLYKYKEHLEETLAIREEELRKKIKIIQESEEKFSTIFNNSAVAITLIDKDEKIIASNPFAQKLLGVKEKDLAGKPVKDLYPEEEWQVIRSHHIRQSGIKHHLETKVIDKDGDSIDVDISISVLKDSEGNIIGSIGIMRDITERRIAERQREQLLHNLEKSNRKIKEAYQKLENTQGKLIQSEKMAALGRFSAGTAHEIKNPLGIILGGIEFLAKKINNPEKDVEFALTKVKDSTLRANNIVQNLLTFAKPSIRKNEAIDLKQLIEETLSLLKYKTPLANIKIINEVKEMPKGIVGDKNQIQQVLFNLFLNAIEAMPKGGKLKVRVSKTSDIETPKGKNNCLIEVTDTGEGISGENLSKIFEPFFTTKRDTKGTGLGLAMCKMLIENNKGKLLISSELGKGTTVKIIFSINNNH